MVSFSSSYLFQVTREAQKPIEWDTIKQQNKTVKTKKCKKKKYKTIIIKNMQIGLNQAITTT